MFVVVEVCDTDTKIWRSLDLGQGANNPARPPLCRVQRSSSVPGNADSPDPDNGSAAKVRSARYKLQAPLCMRAAVILLSFRFLLVVPHWENLIKCSTSTIHLWTTSYFIQVSSMWKTPWPEQEIFCLFYSLVNFLLKPDTVTQDIETKFLSSRHFFSWIAMIWVTLYLFTSFRV